MTDAPVTFVWTGRNRREAIRFLGFKHMGFTGRFPKPGEPDERTVEVKTRSGTVSVHVGQVIRRHADGGLYVTDGARVAHA